MTKLDKKLSGIQHRVKQDLIDALYILSWENGWDEALRILTEKCVPQISAATVLISEMD